MSTCLKRIRPPGMLILRGVEFVVDNMTTPLVCALVSSVVAAVPRGECFVDTCWSVSDVVVQRNITYGSAYDPVLKRNLTLTLDV